MRRRQTLVWTAVLVLAIASACGGGKKEGAARTTTTESATTTTGSPSAGGAPLTGLPADPAKLARPALIVKVDNAPKGRPQEGINRGDVVIEEAVEGGITRLAVLFHSQDPGEVGPVRSARSTDIAIASALNRPFFAYSGASGAFQTLVNKAPLVAVGHGQRAGSYFRKRGRAGPYDLWVRADELFAAPAPGSGPPPPMFVYRSASQPAAGDPAAGIAFEFRGRVVTSVDWQWDAPSATWRRTQNGTPHVDAGGAPVAPRNVVVQFTNYKNTGFVDRSGEPVPEGEVVGEGDVWVLSEGKVVKGKWKKLSPEALTTYVDAAGAPIPITAGQTWLELPKPGTAKLR